MFSVRKGVGDRVLGVGSLGLRVINAKRRAQGAWRYEPRVESLESRAKGQKKAETRKQLAEGRKQKAASRKQSAESGDRGPEIEDC